MPKDEGEPWFTPVPIGKNLLSKMVAEMFSEAGITGRKTNHSLCVLGATTLFDTGVPERIIQQRTGHKSIEGLRIYERVTEDQEKIVSKILTGDAKKFVESVKHAEETKPCSVLGVVNHIRQPETGPQYNNYNINYYSAPAPYQSYAQAFSCQPWFPPPYYSRTNYEPYEPYLPIFDNYDKTDMN